MLFTRHRISRGPVPERGRTAPSPAEASTPAPPWHALTPREALIRLETGEGGLSAAEAAARLARIGPNRLQVAARRSALIRFAAQFHNVLIYVLLASAAVTAALGHWVDTGVILGVVIINAVVGFIQEGKAERALDAIRQMLTPSATVVRDGRRMVVPAETLVPGDIVELGAGDRVPADLRLLVAHGLRIDEAALSGESVPVDKSPVAVPAHAPLTERTSMVYAGTFVTAGQARGVVVATGRASELGRISTMIQEVTTLETPLLRQIGAFARWLTAAILALAAATFLFGTLVRGHDAVAMFMAAVGLAVAAIPEGLPAVMTITFAIGVTRMA
ncbi:MAG: cation-transporting P-type ATPase, partial [Alphaproteobacteria bacterium]